MSRESWKISRPLGPPVREPSEGHRADANILIGLVLGTRVRTLVLDHIGDVEFFAPAVCFADARKYLPTILAKHGVPLDAVQDALEELDGFEGLVQPLEESVYSSEGGRPGPHRLARRS